MERLTTRVLKITVIYYGRCLEVISGVILLVLTRFMKNAKVNSIQIVMAGAILAL